MTARISRRQGTDFPSSAYLSPVASTFLRPQAAELRAQAHGRGENSVHHIMLSYCWDHQATIKRVNASLQARGYTVWIDIEKMQGSTVEAMAEAEASYASAVAAAGLQSYGSRGRPRGGAPTAREGEDNDEGIVDDEDDFDEDDAPPAPKTQCSPRVVDAPPPYDARLARGLQASNGCVLQSSL